VYPPPIETSKTSKRGVHRLAIIGAGAVGSAFAFSQVTAAGARELILADIDVRRAEGQVMDLSHCVPLSRPMQIRAGGLDVVENCDMIVITAGAAQLPGESRLDLVKRNADILASMVPVLAKANPTSILCIITNPVDVMTRLAVKLSGFPKERVFGTGTVLDSSRFRLLLSLYLGVDARNVHGYVIGEHGDSEVLVWSHSSVGPYRLLPYAELVGKPLTAGMREHFTREVRTAAYQIIERKGATNFAIGVSTQRIYEAIHQNQSSMMTVCRALDGVYGFDDLCLSIPCLLTRDGVARPTPLELDPDEHRAFMASAETIDNVYRQLGVV
jgi:L-lactate dehydrogenase